MTVWRLRSTVIAPAVSTWEASPAVTVGACDDCSASESRSTRLSRLRMRAISSRGLLGLVMYSSAPRSKASSRSSSVVRAVSMSTGIPLDEFGAQHMAYVQPLTPGIMTSSTSRSGGLRRISSRAVRPS